MFGLSWGAFVNEDKNSTSISPENTLLPSASTTPEPTQLPVPMQPTLGEKLFLGPDGLRAGWRLLLYLVMMVVVAVVLSVFLQPLRSHIKVELWLMMIGEGITVVAAIAPALVMGLLEKRSFDAYGLPRRLAFGKLFWVGTLWGLVWLTVLMLAMRGLKVFYFGGIALHGPRILKFAAFYGVLFLLVGFFEEFLMRGYTQFALTKMMGFWPTAVLLSLVFGAIHLRNEGEGWRGIISVVMIGFFFCLTLRRTGNLWFAVGFHASWDWGETFLFSVPNSGTVTPGHLLSSSFNGPSWLTGGSVGPEGSVLVYVLIAIMWIVFNRMYPEAKYQRDC